MKDVSACSPCALALDLSPACSLKRGGKVALQRLIAPGWGERRAETPADSCVVWAKQPRLGRHVYKNKDYVREQVQDAQGLWRRRAASNLFVCWPRHTAPPLADKELTSCLCLTRSCAKCFPSDNHFQLYRAGTHIPTLNAVTTITQFRKSTVCQCTTCIVSADRCLSSQTAKGIRLSDSFSRHIARGTRASIRSCLRCAG